MAISTTTVAHIRLTVTDDATRERLGFLFGGVIYDVRDAAVVNRSATPATTSRSS